MIYPSDCRCCSKSPEKISPIRFTIRYTMLLDCPLIAAPILFCNKPRWLPNSPVFSSGKFVQNSPSAIGMATAPLAKLQDAHLDAEDHQKDDLTGGQKVL